MIPSNPTICHVRQIAEGKYIFFVSETRIILQEAVTMAPRPICPIIIHRRIPTIQTSTTDSTFRHQMALSSQTAEGEDGVDLTRAVGVNEADVMLSIRSKTHRKILVKARN